MSNEINDLMKDAGATEMGSKPAEGANNNASTENAQANTQNTNNTVDTKKVDDKGVATQSQETKAVDTNTNTSSETNASQEDVWKIDRFNKEIGREFTDINEVRGLLEKADKVGGLEEQLNNLKDVYSKTNKPWANDEIQRLNEIFKKNPDVPKNVVSALASENIDEMSPKDLLIWKHRLENPNDKVENSRLSEFIDMNYGLNSQIDSIEDDTERESATKQNDYNKFRLDTEANKFRQELKSKFDVEVTADVNVDEVINQFKLDKETSVNERKTKFAPIVDGLAKDFNNLQITDPATNEVVVDVVVDDKFKQGLPGFMLKTAIDQGLDPANLQDIQKLKKLASDVYFVSNKQAIFKKFASDIETKMKDTQYNEQHNTESTKTYTSNAPAGGKVKASQKGTKAEVNAQIADDLGIGK